MTDLTAVNIILIGLVFMVGKHNSNSKQNDNEIIINSNNKDSNNNKIITIIFGNI